MLKIWYWDTWLRPSCRIWVCTEKLGIPKLLGVNSNSATRPELSIPIKLGSRLDGTSGMVPRWVATCQLHQLHFCVFWALVGLLLWSHVLGHERNPDQTIQLLRSTLKIFEVLPYFIVLLHLEQHRYFGAMDGFDLAFDHRHPVFKSHIETVHGLPKKSIYVQVCAPKVSGVATLLDPGGKRWIMGVGEIFDETLSWPEDCIGHESNCTLSGPQSSGGMRHKIDASGREARNVATTFDTRSEETNIDDTPRCHQIRAENAWKVRLNRLRR